MPEPGWYNDERDSTRARWHDGSRWTEHTIVKAEWAGRGKPPPPAAADDWGAPATAPPPAQRAFTPPPAQYAPPPGPSADDRRMGRADGKAEKARQKALRPWYQKKRFLLPIGVIVIAVIASAAGGGDDDKESTETAGESSDGDATDNNSAAQENSDADELDDVTITGCEVNFGLVSAPMTVVNNSSDVSNYVIEFEVTDSSGVKVGDGLASTNNVAAGQTAKIEGFATASDAAVDPVSCVLTSVERYAAG